MRESNDVQKTFEVKRSFPPPVDSPLLPSSLHRFRPTAESFDPSTSVVSSIIVCEQRKLFHAGVYEWNSERADRVTSLVQCDVYPGMDDLVSANSAEMDH
jgi:hypothetical protein